MLNLIKFNSAKILQHKVGLKDQIKDNIDILMISETKIDDAFPHSQFLIEGFSTTYRLDRDSNGGGILLYVREDISFQLNCNRKQTNRKFRCKAKLA